MDQDPSKAGHAEKESDGQENVGYETQKNGGPMNFKASLIRIWYGIVTTVRQAIAGQAQGHAELPVGLLELFICWTLVLGTISAGLSGSQKFVAGENKVDLRLKVPIWQFDLYGGWIVECGDYSVRWINMRVVYVVPSPMPCVNGIKSSKLSTEKESWIVCPDSVSSVV